MFKIQTSYHDTRVEIEFPCSNNMLYAKLAELHIPDEKKVTAQLFIEEIDYEELKCLENTFVDPDILNHIAQKMDSFDSKELKKFDAVVNTYSLSSPRDLVNLTFNMHYYTLIEDLSNLEKVGKTHMLTRCQVLTTDNSEGYDFYKIGKDLIASDTGKMTQYGILFVNDDLPYEKPYLGASLPSFEYDSDKFITLQLIYEDKSAYVYLPDCPFGIERAVHRIGADSITDCKVYVDKYSFDDGHQTILSNVLKNEGVYALNNLSLELSKANALLDEQSKRYRTSITPRNHMLSKMIYCKECGTMYRRKSNDINVYWVCRKKDQYGSECSSTQISEKVICDGFINMYNRLVNNVETILTPIVTQLTELRTQRLRSTGVIENINKEIAEISEQILMYQEMKLQGYMESALFLEKSQEAKTRISMLQKEKKILMGNDDCEKLIKKTESIINIIKITGPIGEVEKTLLNKVLNKIWVDSGKNLIYELINGLKLTVSYQEVR